MGHSLRYSDQEPFLAGSGYDNTAIEHYKYLSESEPIGDSAISPVVSPRVRSLHHDMQALRISRQDNPYLQQKLERTSISNGEDTPFSSPRKQEQEKLVDDSDEEDSEMNDEGIISLHQHLIRSPPPHFPPNVTKFRFPDTRSVAPASSPLVGKQLSDTLYDPTTGRSATPAYALDPNLPVTTSIAKVSNLNASQKEKMPLLPIDEKFLPQQNEAGDYQRWEAPSNKIPTASEVVFDREQMTLRNRQLSQGSCDLNPILIKSGVDVLDPGMREVLEFQKHKIVHETGLRLPEPLGTTAVGVSEVNVPVITGRLSAEGTVPTCHYISPRSSIGSSCSYNLKSLQTLQPMGGSIQPPSTAPTFPTSPTKPMMLPMKNVGMTSPPAALLSPLPPLGASVSTFLPSTEPLKSSSEGVFEPTKKLLAQ